MPQVAEALRRFAPKFLRQAGRADGCVPIRKALSAIMRCRTGELGGVRRDCKRCGKRHCFLVTFTVPREIGSVLRIYQRAGYEALYKSSADSLAGVAAATRGLRGFERETGRLEIHTDELPGRSRHTDPGLQGQTGRCAARRRTVRSGSRRGLEEGLCCRYPARR